MKRLVVIDEFVFDANTVSKHDMEGLVRLKFDSHTTQPGMLKFTYDKTADGYQYVFSRNLPYSYSGNLISALDCSFLTGLPIEKFEVDPTQPNKKPVVYCFPGRNGYYVPIVEFENFYKQLLGCGGDTEKPKKVKVQACNSFVNVEVHY